MTPKEKADQLYYFYFNLLEPFGKYNYRLLVSRAILSALICVNEILNLDSQDVYMDYTFWNNVKKELEAMKWE